MTLDGEQWERLAISEGTSYSSIYIYIGIKNNLIWILLQFSIIIFFRDIKFNKWLVKELCGKHKTSSKILT